MTRNPASRGFWDMLIGLLIGAGLMAGVSIATEAPRTCVMRTADGCVMWADIAKIERYKRGQAGSASYSSADRP